MIDPLTLAVTAVAVFLISFVKGAFGGGFAIIGIPLLALVMDPITAGAVLAPLFCVQDVVGIRYWRPSTWSRPDLAVLIPGQMAGMTLGFFALRYADRNVVAIAIATITLLFAVLWFLQGGKIVQRPRSRVKGVIAGVASGTTSMLAHSGGPPLAMYLLPLGLPKHLYAGTTFVFFITSNFIKVWPWLIIGNLSWDGWGLVAFAVPVTAFGVWAGWRLHERLSAQQLYRLCYALLIAVGLNLLWSGIQGYARP